MIAIHGRGARGGVKRSTLDAMSRKHGGNFAGLLLLTFVVTYSLSLCDDRIDRKR